MLLRGGHVWGFLLSRTFLRKGSRLFLHLRLAPRFPLLRSIMLCPFIVKNYFLSSWNAFSFIVKCVVFHHEMRCLSSWNAFSFIMKCVFFHQKVASLRKERTSLQKQRSFLEKQRTFLQKRRTFLGKSPSFFSHQQQSALHLRFSSLHNSRKLQVFSLFYTKMSE